MNAAIARLLPRASATSVASIESFVTIALLAELAYCFLYLYDSGSVHPRRMVLIHRFCVA